MFKEEFNKVAGAASAKNQLLKNNKLGYFISSMLFGNCIESVPAFPSTKDSGILTFIVSRIEGCLILY